MFGKSSTSIHNSDNQVKANAALSLGAAAVLLAVIGLFTPNASLMSGLLPAECGTGALGNTGVYYNRTNGADGISAYNVWLNEGNTGDTKAFLKSLIGTKGAQGYAGKDGKSAYQLWLDAGNKGTTNDFLTSLVGAKGVDGLAGLSAYELWLSTGHEGTLQNFLNSLTGSSGTSGANGTNGTNGLSAYEIWKNQSGNSSKTVAEFLSSLIGPTGPAGANGSNGTNGTNGVDGAVGPSGPAGPSGAPGANGTNGTCTIGVGGYFASFWDETTQVGSQPVNGMMLGNTATHNGITAVTDTGALSTPAAPGSWIKFDNAGTYNISFSAQLAKTGGSAATISIWLQKLNGSVQDLAYTNTDIGLANNTTEQAAAWNFFVDVAAGDRIRLAWHTNDVTAVLKAATPTTSGGASIPGIPSVIVTVNQVR